jgi:hypothetical protein
VVSVANESPDYFETPAPGWTWGSRFSMAWLENTVRNLGGTIVDKHFNELEGNKNPRDRGSGYFLVRKD